MNIRTCGKCDNVLLFIISESRFYCRACKIRYKFFHPITRQLIGKAGGNPVRVEIPKDEPIPPKVTVFNSKKRLYLTGRPRDACKEKS